MEYLQYRVYDFIKSRVTGVLNLIITGIPSILRTNLLERELISVLNLIITGIPSIHKNNRRRKTAT